MSNNGGYKKKYFRKSYGKFYTYRRLRNIMNTYFRAKLSLALNTAWNNNIVALNPVGVGQAANILTLAELCFGVSSWPSYRNLFTFYKPRGVLVESDPKFQNVGYYDTQNNQAHLPYDGQVAVGLINTNNNPGFRALMDSNHFLILSTVSKQRAYWPFVIKDFSELPIAANNPTAIPYYIVINNDEVPQANCILPSWTVRLTFYITFRQSTM
jgi:hypothetical protein